MNTPIAFIIFNRPEQTRQVFEAIRQLQPTQLFIIADGPRYSHQGDLRACDEVREIVNEIDWDCDVHRKMSGVNIGCGRNVSEGLDWVFSQVEEAIILEDDCLPHPDFFRFCSELLNRYREEKRVMSIGGTNVLGEWKSREQSYHFSLQGSIWGWASWRRAWRHFDFHVTRWQESNIKDLIQQKTNDDGLYQWRRKKFDLAYSHAVDTWDYQWLFCRIVNSGLTILPAKNLVSNIGFGSHATHTKSSDSALAKLVSNGMEFPLKISNEIAIDNHYEKELAHMILKTSGEISVARKTARRLKSFIADYFPD